MSAFVSKPVEQGHLVVVNLHEAEIAAKFAGEETPRDITVWFADLVLLGLGVRHELATGQTAEPAEQVEVCQVAVVGDEHAVTVIYIHHPSQVAEPLDVSDALALAAAGIAAQITAGVAFEAVQGDADIG